MKYSSLLALIIPLIISLPACKKEPGIGGDASVRGRIWVRDYNSTFTTLISEYPGKDVYVYIVYGDHTGYDKRIKTDYKGEFEFRYLYPGKYTIYTYSLDSTLMDLSGSIPVIKEVNINEREEEIDLQDLLIFK